uniref:Uncharacterized protein n=1 Tax=Molossus molossus TaxID=27622 RepID=A0A7J8CRM6_MOLMO|nr:hypothetical protein HJG59_009748 [Molossus molossus]
MAILLIFLFIFIFINLFLLQVFLLFTPLTPSSPSPPPTPSPALLSMFIGYAYMHISSVVYLFPTSSEVCQSVPYFYVSESILFICFVHYIPQISEIMRYLSFSAWLVSLRIILFRSLHVIHLKG